MQEIQEGQEEYFLVTVHRKEMDREDRSSGDKAPVILGFVARVGVGELRIFHTRAELLEHLGLSTRRGDDYGIQREIESRRDSR
ncbi:MAG TPA: hypothetical protein VN277_09295 [Acidiferrobacterales bacterium]|nr:hypothetical protein [Acidiferrobacterales bacterium]